MYKVWKDVNELRDYYFGWEKMPFPDGLLMVTPRYFDVVDVKNPYMQENIGNISRETADAQWDNLYAEFEKLKDVGVMAHLEKVEGEEGLEDMVFCANPVFYWLKDDGKPMVLLSNMRHQRRQNEVEIFKQYFESQGIETIAFPENIKVEGNGDLIPHPGYRAVWMGYGFRTDIGAADFLTEILQAHIIPLKLVSEDFYHLDTCFCIIDAENVAICPDAFDEESISRIMAIFSHVHEIPLVEAKENFALNALVMSSYGGEKYGIIPKGNPTLKNILQELSVHIAEFDTSEYIKSGGSVYCMKMFTYKPLSVNYI